MTYTKEWFEKNSNNILGVGLYENNWFKVEDFVFENWNLNRFTFLGKYVIALI